MQPSRSRILQSPSRDTTSLTRSPPLPDAWQEHVRKVIATQARALEDEISAINANMRLPKPSNVLPNAHRRPADYSKCAAQGGLVGVYLGSICE